MTPFTLLLRSITLLLGLLSIFSGCAARVLPKVKRDNSTCCGFKITNRGDIRFLYEHIIDFSTVCLSVRRCRCILISAYQLKTLDQVTKAGWGISNGWKIGSANPTTAQVAWADENNVKLSPGVGLMMTVPGRESLDKRTSIRLTPHQDKQQIPPVTLARKSPFRGWSKAGISKSPRCYPALSAPPLI